MPGGINDHGPIGVLVMSGDAFRNGVRSRSDSVRDITPTILTLCGLPVGEDMDGAVIEEAFEPEFLRSHPSRRIPTYEVPSSAKTDVAGRAVERSPNGGSRGGRADNEKTLHHRPVLRRRARVCRARRRRSSRSSARSCSSASTAWSGTSWVPCSRPGAFPRSPGSCRRARGESSRSLDILESPVIWTSIATGKLPEKHGITGFAKKSSKGGEPVPVTSNVRRVEAIWDILGNEGWSVGHRRLVVDLAGGAGERLPRDGLLQLRVEPRAHRRGRPRDLPARARGGHRRPESPRRGRSRRTRRPVHGRRGARGRAPSRKRFDALKALRRDRRDQPLGRRFALADRMPVDFYAVYLKGIDGVCHLYWVDMLPESGPPITTRTSGGRSASVIRALLRGDGRGPCRFSRDGR